MGSSSESSSITPPESNESQSPSSTPSPPNYAAARERRERKRMIHKLRLEIKLTDDELLEVLAEAYEEDTILLTPHFARYYVQHDWLTDQEIASVL